jgi:hypothetical protein
MHDAKTFAPRPLTNPRAHSRAPFAVRAGANRPTGSYATVAEAVEAGRIGDYVVTVDGWWIQGYIEREQDAPKTEAQAAADAIIAANGEPKSPEALRAMLALAYTQGASAGITEAADSFQRVMDSFKSA